MVGPFGEVYVMDWGLARVLGRETAPAPEGTGELASGRREARESMAQSSLITLDGEIVGTPAYMSPEQAKGRHQEVGPASDVYSIGAILYYLLAGREPYCNDDGSSASAHVVLMALMEGAAAAHSDGRARDAR